MALTEAETEEGVAEIKQLASCDSKTRNAALRFLLDTWLPSQSRISDHLMKKLWKGLFYCVWHADKLPAQTYIINSLSSLVTQLHLPLSIDYFTVFLLTMRREWPGIDRLRLDKFYLLIRTFVRSFFLLLKNNYWDLELSRRMMGVLLEAMGSNEALPCGNGNGVNYHIVSVFMEELRPFLPLRSEILELLLGPLVSIMGRVPDKVLLSKIKTNVFDGLLTMGNKLLELHKSNSEICNEDDVMVLGSVALAFGFSTKFYESGSSLECCQGNRKVLFGLHEEFLKLEKAFTSSGIQISFPEKANGEDDEVPILVPIASGMGVHVANAIPKKKKKKEKEKKSKVDQAKEKGKRNKKAVNFGSASENNNDHNEDKAVPNAESSIGELNGNHVDLITFNESAISNLQMQFEKVAADVGFDMDVASACDSPKLNGNGATAPKKRKRAKSVGEILELAGDGDVETTTITQSKGNSAKKVRFSMKHNLVWKPHSPLPPQSLRLPPSVTPRGSALKKGIPPGPIKEMPAANKKVKQRAKSVKKGRKVIRRIAPAIKHLKLKSLSA